MCVCAQLLKQHILVSVFIAGRKISFTTPCTLTHSLHTYACTLQIYVCRQLLCWSHLVCSTSVGAIVSGFVAQWHWQWHSWWLEWLYAYDAQTRRLTFVRIRPARSCPSFPMHVHGHTVVAVIHVKIYTPLFLYFYVDKSFCVHSLCHPPVYLPAILLFWCLLLPPLHLSLCCLFCNIYDSIQCSYASRRDSAVAVLQTLAVAEDVVAAVAAGMQKNVLVE